MAQKNGGGGPEGILRWKIEGQELYWGHELPTVLEKEIADYNPIGLPEIDDVVQTWFRVYHSLVLLVAATDSPKDNLIYDHCGFNNPDEDDFYVGLIKNDHGKWELRESHRVPAFYTDEATCNGGWIYKKIKNEFDTRAKQLETYGDSFLNNLLQLIPKIDAPLQRQPALQYFLDKFKNLPSNFDHTTCLKTCRGSISEISVSHKNTRRSMEMALSLIDKIWGDDLDSHLNEMRNWLDSASSSIPAGSETWLKEKFQLSQLEEPISELFRGNDANDRSKLEAVSIESIKLHLNTRTFNYIYHRFVDEDSDVTSKGLEKVIKDISDKEEWQDLLWATYGAIAWQIYRQIQVSIEKVKQITAVN